MTEEQYDFVENDFVSEPMIVDIPEFNTVHKLSITLEDEEVDPTMGKLKELSEKIDCLCSFAIELADWLTDVHPEGHIFDPIINRFIEDIENLSEGLDILSDRA